MRKAKIVSGSSCLLVMILSALNLLLRDRMYADAEASAFFLANDIVNIIASAALLFIHLVSKPPRGLFIGIDAALVYLAVPLLLVHAPSLYSLIPAVAAAAALYGIIDELKIEEVLVNEQAPIKREHVWYICISFLFCVFFIVRAALILAGSEALAGERITSIADLVLAALWIVLTVVAIINADKRIPALTGIMTSGAALEFCLILFLVLDAVSKRDGGAALDIAVVACMCVAFGALSYRLLKRT